MATLQTLFPPHLTTPRLTLQLYNRSPAHYTTLLSAMNSPTAHTHMGDFGVRTPAEFDAFNARARTLDARFQDGVADDDLYYLIRLGVGNAEGELVGGVSLSQRRARDSQGGEIVLPPDVGWCLLEGYMGRGYATEAAGELMRFAREVVGWREMVAFASERNPA
ncbi:hypothetical protein M409DRAFT_21474, partial [Zasmidium cellare ATCC 36951]